MLVLSGISGFSYDFDLYAGKQSNVVPENVPNLGTSSNVVLRLFETVPTHLNYKVFFDNWFTNVELVAHLHQKGILLLGTVRANRISELDNSFSRQGPCQETWKGMIDGGNCSNIL